MIIIGGKARWLTKKVTDQRAASKEEDQLVEEKKSVYSVVKRITK